MPKGKAPYPKQKVVSSGRADKAKAVHGGYERTEGTNEASGRRITYPGGGSATLGKYPAPSGTHSKAPSTTADKKYTPKKKK